MSEQGAVLLELRHTGKQFGPNWAVRDLNLTVHQGEIFTLLGPSGCGKTTTLRIIAGLEQPETGEVLLKGKTIVDAAARYFAPPDKRNMGMVFQSYAVWPHITVFENVAFPLRLRRESGPAIEEKVMNALTLIGLPDIAKKYPWQLSGGQQQRVALARALVYSPDILLLDEPLSNLDAKLREQMRVELRSLQRRLGTTFLFVTHDQAEAMILSTRIAVMSQGHVEQLGTPAEVYERPATPFVRDFLGRSVVVSGVVHRQRDGVLLELELGARIVMDQVGAPLPDGTPVVVACRSECIGLEPAREPAPHQVPATVEDVAYLGTHVDYIVRAGHRLFTVQGSGDARFPVGASILLCFGKKGLTVWPHGS